MFRTILVNPLFNALALVYALIPGHDLGLAVIVLTALIRLLLWPLFAKQLHSQRALQELQPEIAKIRAKAKGDRQLESKLLMELYKEREISPFASLVPVLIQLPIFIALYLALRGIVVQGEIAKLAYEPIKQLSAIKAIINHTATFKPTLLGLIDLTKPSIILAVTAAAAQFYQTRQIMPKVETKGDATAATNKFATYLFPLITFAIALRLPSALALYWTVTSIIAIIQQAMMLKRDVEEMEGEKLPAASKKSAKGAK